MAIIMVNNNNCIIHVSVQIGYYYRYIYQSNTNTI